MARLEMIAAMNEPAFGAAGQGGRALTIGTPDRWRHSSSRGRMTVDDFATMIAWHDDNHLDQLRRALIGKV